MIDDLPVLFPYERCVSSDMRADHRLYPGTFLCPAPTLSSAFLPRSYVDQ